MRLGVDYYPEQWPRERRPVDFALMAEAGIGTVRMAEFAWALLEPRPGAHDFAWLDEAIELADGHGIEVILGTPTAAPPAWLVEQHPEILPTRVDGRVQQFGHRRHYCPNQPAFREASRRIVAALADRYGSDPRVVAWQIDNELGGRCFCDCCRSAFQEWLRDRYGSIEELNERWGTVFWSQTYSSWSQIPLPEAGPVPLPDGFLRNAPNPSLALDYRRFVSDGHVRFLRLQAEELRARCSPSQRITHNLMGFRFAEIDYHDLARELDVVSWDNYPQLDRSGRWTSPALAADAMRGLGRAPVWVLEQQVGPLGWETLRTPRRGQFRLFTFQAIAHGAELVSYFRWRTARHGTEQHWHGILDAHGQPGRRHRELRALATELDALREPLADAEPAARVALVHDYDSRFALQVQPTNPALAYEETLQQHYEAVRRLGLGVDVVSPAGDLSGYALVLAPSLYVVDEELAAGLRRYVEAGGRLVLAPRAGIKDRGNVLHERPLPALLDELAGLEATDYASLLDGGEVRFAGIDGLPGGSFHGWYEELQLKGAAALALYADGEFADTPAIASNAVGAGRVVYVGGAAGSDSLALLYAMLAAEAGLETLELPADVEAVPLRRSAGEAALLFLLNHAGEERAVRVPGGCRDLIAGAESDGAVTLPPFGVALLEPVPARLEGVR